MKSVRMILVLCAISAAATGGSVAAAMQNDRPLVVQAKPIDPDVPTRRVGYADLNLASAAGEKTLYKRVGAAVRDVCEESTGPNAIMWFESRCHRFAWNGATPQIEQALRRARDIAATGNSSIAPVAIRIAIP